MRKKLLLSFSISKWTLLLTLFFSNFLAFSQTNLALTANVTTSFVSEWETLEAVKDDVTPVDSNDTPRYGNWNYEQNYGVYNWVEYSWNTDQVIKSANVYWGNDGGGLLPPDDAYIEYFDGTEWVKVGDIGFLLNTYNGLNMDVTTSKIRVHMKSTTATSIIEFQVFDTELNLSTSNISELDFLEVYTSASGVVIDNNSSKSLESVKLYNVVGSMVYQATNIKAGNYTIHQSNSGVYIVEIVIDGLRYSKKVIITE
ncbi:T9SS type A sorting domain-containing protein [Wenyingzhuangia marina]|uniref:Por secretion system C-terminal sorting domain-containing protein n=1 Tax=Wenyingzhuangia marina TaxID=1195760 RepID=A0A1M5WZT7_9FLAO|nr:T9SS type A sorting domain-containing protein [Wenyingzhuangia marina]GGF82965.1 hypothetical protein GCM10011397_27410 [Wenyingzhuangia marina]SHH92788.1 Por secretion system C-terminal sorting domain-containing protein [Wenyingzhuangia marina]